MSDFISRVAARAVGERTTAAPRVPSLFEPHGGADDPMLEVIDAETVARAPERSVRDVAPAAPHESAKSRARVAPASAAPGVEIGRGADVDSSERREPSRDSPQPSPPVVDDRVPEPVGAARRNAPLGSPQESSAPPAVVVAGPQLAPAVPVGTVPRARVVPAPAPTGPAEPPPVRVHIGRLEVRASLQEPANEQPRRERPRAPELSLADYLRGRRDPR